MVDLDLPTVTENTFPQSSTDGKSTSLRVGMSRYSFYTSSANQQISSSKKYSELMVISQTIWGSSFSSRIAETAPGRVFSPCPTDPAHHRHPKSCDQSFRNRSFQIEKTQSNQSQSGFQRFSVLRRLWVGSSEIRPPFLTANPDFLC